MSFPRELSAYADPAHAGMWEVIQSRAAAEPFNVAVTAIFALAVLHTFFCPKLTHAAHAAPKGSPRARMLHVLGEVEMVFGLWVVVLAAAFLWAKGPGALGQYFGSVSFTEPLFVIVIMALASTRPVMRLAEQSLRRVAALGGGRPVAWWLSILTVAPLLGSFITEPAAMTIAALLLAKQFYDLRPSPRLMYATLGLLFVNISIGGTLTHFAAPPVLMVAAAWGWDIAYMFTHFGWHAVAGILLSNVVYLLVFKSELLALRAPSTADGDGTRVPVWVTLVHLLFLGFTVWAAHHPAWFIPGFGLFLGFVRLTARHQDKLAFRSPLLVGFFLAGLVVHGGLQGWWIEPVLGGLGQAPLFVGATILTAFNDNALITYLATLVPNFTEELKFAVVSGAVTGGGLTVIANAPNPAGQSILQRYFPDGVSPLGLLLGALVPTLLVAFSFMVL
ncbi:putative Na+/H+ antiporter [Opitutus sp. GAS368]|uniref:putative Na+/H+ antiporter n=1 Tax=Opitutus sp. GAS368 TaxID=1882749 RepID=UPI000879837F|nr:putative Na+/H+ antiporter [Opitutus sp. GAS368]SDS65071.1 Na+/H+ antiporter NhaD [Opitutus sp. GAS368]